MLIHPLIAKQLFFGQRAEVIFSQSADEAGAAEDVQQLAGFGIPDGPVWFQTQQLALFVADDGSSVIFKGIDCFYISP